MTRSTRRRLASALAGLAVRLDTDRAAGATNEPRDGSSWRRMPRNWHVSPPPRDPTDPWPTPPLVQDALAVPEAETPPDPLPVMDVALLAALNEEYRNKPLVPEPMRYDPTSAGERAKARLGEIHRSIDLAGKRVLELGCGGGYETWFVSHHFGSDAWGVDVEEHVSWAAFADERTHYVLTDIGRDHSFEADSFDRVISTTVFEHVHHPYATLAELYRIMKPGGLAWIRANLHRGPMASHLYRELFLPFPHLLFSDEVIAEYRKGTSGVAKGAAWVNNLTWAQYEDYLREIGFEMLALRFTETPLDEALYRRFSHILERYPRWELTRDFFRVVLRKPLRPMRSKRRGEKRKRSRASADPRDERE